MPAANASAKNGQTSSAPLERHQQQADEDADLHHDRERVDRAPRDAVRQLPRRQREQREREELREPDEPEVERVAANLVDLPADGDRRHLRCERRGEERDPEEREVAVAERGWARHELA